MSSSRPTSIGPLGCGFATAFAALLPVRVRWDTGAGGIRCGLVLTLCPETLPGNSVLKFCPCNVTAKACFRLNVR